MAKKFVRGITDIKQINQQDFDTNNVNDLLSDGEYNYIHRKKKDKSEEYHNLTDNIKTISSDNEGLLSVTNYNQLNNTATLHPHHDALKEQVIESERNTIDITHGENGTSETTKVDTNPQKVLEHANLIAGDNLTKEHVADTNTTTLKVSDDFTNKVNKATNDIVSINSTINELKETKQDKLTGVNTQTATTVLTSNNVRVNVKISEDEGNLLDIHNDGLFVEKPTTGLTPQHIAYGTRGQSYYAFKEVFGQRTTYTIEVVQGEPELTVVGPLKTDLTSKLATVSTLTNGAITLTYNGTDVKIITNTSPSNGVEQATFTFYNI